MKENKQMTEQELDNVTAGAELSDEELDGVAGGYTDSGRVPYFHEQGQFNFKSMSGMDDEG